MTVRTDGARHRAARRSITPLAALSTGATGNAAALGRRTAIVAASSGLLVSLMGAAPATAAPASADAALSTFDVDTLAAQASAALVTAPAVTVAADASWTVEQTSITVTPAPEPEPEPEPEPVRATTTTSRSAERTSVATAAVTKTSAPAEIPASANGSAIIDAASRYVGVPYVSGGSTPAGFDCSGFTSYVFAQVGISLPRTSGAQAGAGTVVSRADAQPGDLIYSPGHIAIYAGGNTQIDAPRPGKTIQFRDIWQSNPTFIRVG